MLVGSDSTTEELFALVIYPGATNILLAKNERNLASLGGERRQGKYVELHFRRTAGEPAVTAKRQKKNDIRSYTSAVASHAE